MQVSRYHSFLRISVVTTALVLLFDGGFIVPITKEFADITILHVASVGSSVLASVPPNELNTLSAEISEQQRLLDAREAALREREIDAREYGEGSETDYSTYVISTILFILTVLLVLNYAMDWSRLKSYRYEKSMG